MEIRGSIFSITRHTSQNDKLYIILVIRYNIPFDTKYLKFCVWDESKLTHNGVQLKKDDTVIVNYHYDGCYTVLDEIEPQQYDVCFQCFMFHQQIDSQRFECEYCSSKFLTEPARKRLTLDLKVVEKTTKSFKYSLGLCLKFLDETTKTYYNATVFENSPLYDLVSKSALLKTYSVHAWKDFNSEYNTIDIVDIF